MSNNHDKISKIGCSNDSNHCDMAIFMETTNQTLGHLMEFRIEAKEKLGKIEHLETALGQVAEHTKSMNETLREMKETATELIAIATGKTHVPLGVFFLVIASMVAIMLMDKLGSHKAELDLSPTQFKYKPSYDPNGQRRIESNE